jgi:hypothetical protein
MSIKVKKDEESGEYYLDINDLAPYFDDINQISYYTITELSEGQLMVAFFDENDNKVPLKTEK